MGVFVSTHLRTHTHTHKIEIELRIIDVVLSEIFCICLCKFMCRHILSYNFIKIQCCKFFLILYVCGASLCCVSLWWGIAVERGAEEEEEIYDITKVLAIKFTWSEYKEVCKLNGHTYLVTFLTLIYAHLIFDILSDRE